MGREQYAQADEVLAFWLEAGPGAWFVKNPDLDRRFRERFMDLHFAAARRELDHWLEDADAALALVLLLDQFPRNAFRDTPHMYATDSLARKYAKLSIARGHATQLQKPLALFLCVPFIHSEDLDDQRRGVQLYKQYAPENLAFAEEHCDIIACYGRFPHRNVILGRESTQQEMDFLRQGGFSG
jgi:uncharacterized protein (DUF924 family)